MSAAPTASIILLPYASPVPEGFLPCAGELLPIVRFQALFSLIGTTFGGDGVDTFALPDFAGSAPEGSYYFISTGT